MPNSKPRLEATICKNIQRQLLAIPGCYVEKRHGGTYTTAGRPDLSGCYRSRRFEMEVKRPGGALTDLQFIELMEWVKAGAVCSVVTSEEEAMAIFHLVQDEKIMQETVADGERITILISRHVILPKKAACHTDFWNVI